MSDGWLAISVLAVAGLSGCDRSPSAAQPVVKPSAEKPAPAPVDVAPARRLVARSVTAAAEAADPCTDTPDDMGCVPAGWFIRGVDHDDHRCNQYGAPHDRASSSVPSARVYVDTFYMDKYEVTNGDWRACADAGKCPDVHPKYFDFRAPKQPITGVSWYQARAYCRAQGKRLPTEAEFEKAARGPHGDKYPWGNDPVTCEHAVIKDERGRACGKKKRRGEKPETGRVWPIGSKPPGRYGLYDIVGNAEEWVADWWSRDWKACGEACRGKNPRGPCDGTDDCPGHPYKVVRGGSWYWGPGHATGYHRRRHHPDNHPYHHFGFRCAKSP